MNQKLRRIYEYYSGYVLLLLISMMATALFYGLSTSGPLMRDTADQYLNEFDLEDIKIVSSHGIDQEELEIINHLEDLNYIELGYQMDVNIDETKNLISVESIPESWIKYDLVRGDFPKNPGEIAIDSSIEGFPYDIGEEITLVLKGNNPTQRLQQYKFKITGFIRSPEYILNIERGASSITGSRLDGYALILPEDFDIANPNFARLHLNSTRRFSPFTTEYRAIVDNQTFLLREAFKDLPETKVERIKEQATQRIADSKAAIDKLNKELADSQGKVDRETKALEALKKDYETKKTEYDGLVTKSNRDIQHGESTTKTLEQQIESLQTSYEQTKTDYDAQATVTAELLTNLNNKRSYVEGQRSYLNGLQANLDTEKSEVYDRTNENGREISSLKRNLSSLKVQLSIFTYRRDELNNRIRDVEGSISRLESEKTYLDTRLSELNTEQAGIDEQFQVLQPDIDELSRLEGEYSAESDKQTSLETSMNSLKAELDTATLELDTVRKDYEQAKQFLEKDQTKMAKEVETLEKKYQEGEASLVTNAESLSSYTEKTQDEIKHLEELITRSEEELKGEIQPTYLISNSSDNQGMRLYYNITKRVDMISLVFPSLFMAIALIAVYIITASLLRTDRRLWLPWTATRERTAVLTVYLKRVFIFLGFGIGLGLLVGYLGIARVVFLLYERNFTFSRPILQIYPLQLLLVTALFLSASLIPFARIWTRKAKELQHQSSFINRKIWLESFTGYWNRISELKRTTLRSLYAAPGRLVLFLLCMTSLTGLLFLGLGLRSSITEIPKAQYEQLMTFDATVFLTPGINSEELSDFTFFLTDIKNARAVERVGVIPGKTQRLGEPSVEFDLIVPSNTEGFSRMVNLVDSSDKTTVHLHPNAAVITKKLADMEGLGPGDKLYFTIDDVTRLEVSISRIVDNYVHHYMYMTPEYYSLITGTEPVLNTDYVVLKDRSPFALGNFETESARYTAVQSIQTQASEKQRTLQMIEPIGYIADLYILCATILLFFIIRYLMDMDVKKRLGEVMHVLKDPADSARVLREINRENMGLVFLAAALGVGLGLLLFWYTATDIVPDEIKFVPYLNWITYVVTIGSVLLLAWIAQARIHGKFQNQGRIGEPEH